MCEVRFCHLCKQNRTSASGNSQARQHSSSSSCRVSVEDQDTEDVGGTMIHEQAADISDDRLEIEQLEQAKEMDNTTSSDSDKEQIVIELRNPEYRATINTESDPALWEINADLIDFFPLMYLLKISNHTSISQSDCRI